MRACRRGDVDVIKALLEKGADVESRDQYGATALIIAASECKVDATRLLLEKGANTFAKDRNGWTALMWASSVGHSQTITLLRNYGSE